MLSLAKKFKIYSWLFIYPEHLKDSSVLKENTETIYPGQQSIRKSGHKASRGVLSTQIYSPDRRKGLKKCHVFVPRRRPSFSLSSTANNPLKLYNRGRTREKQIAANNSLWNTPGFAGAEMSPSLTYQSVAALVMIARSANMSRRHVCLAGRQAYSACRHGSEPGATVSIHRPGKFPNLDPALGLGRALGWQYFDDLPAPTTAPPWLRATEIETSLLEVVYYAASRSSDAHKQSRLCHRCCTLRRYIVQTKNAWKSVTSNIL